MAIRRILRSQPLEVVVIDPDAVRSLHRGRTEVGRGGEAPSSPSSDGDTRTGGGPGSPPDLYPSQIDNRLFFGGPRTEGMPRQREIPHPLDADPQDLGSGRAIVLATQM